MTASESQKPRSRASSLRPAAEKTGRSPGEHAAAVRLRVDVPARQAAEQWQLTYDALHDLIAVLDDRNRIVQVNKAMAERLGLSKQQCVGQACCTCFHGTDMPRSFCPHLQLLQDGQERTFEAHDQRLASDFLVTISPLRDSAGRLTGCVHVARDITQCKRAQEALRESEQRYRVISKITSTYAYSCRIEPDGRFVREWISGDYFAITGATPEEVDALEGGIQNLVYADDLSIHMKRKERLLQGEPDVSEYRIVTRQGEIRWVQVYGEPQWDEAENRVVRFYGAVVDITQRKRAEQAMRQAAKTAATGRIAAHIAHEINNPLAGIAISFQLIKAAVPKDHPDYDLVGRIEREIDRIASVVRQTYKLYSPRARTPTDIPVEQTIRDVLVMLEPLCREREVTIELAPVSPKLIVWAPEGGLQQILYNLIVNAVQASDQGRVVNIQVELRDSNYVRISICDQGPGIPVEVQERIFEPFFSADSGGGTKKGIGLGLSIVRNIVQSVGGKIEVESGVGQGACFRVCLPSKQP